MLDESHMNIGQMSDENWPNVSWTLDESQPDVDRISNKCQLWQLTTIMVNNYHDQ
jgi:hypothetical protein